MNGVESRAVFVVCVACNHVHWTVSDVRICVYVFEVKHFVIAAAIMNADHGACIHFPFMSYLFKNCSPFMLFSFEQSTTCHSPALVIVRTLSIQLKFIHTMFSVNALDAKSRQPRARPAIAEPNFVCTFFVIDLTACCSCYIFKWSAVLRTQQTGNCSVFSVKLLNPPRCFTVQCSILNAHSCLHYALCDVCWSGECTTFNCKRIWAFKSCFHCDINIKGDVYLFKAHLNPLSFAAAPIYAARFFFLLDFHTIISKYKTTHNTNARISGQQK